MATGGGALLRPVRRHADGLRGRVTVDEHRGPVLLYCCERARDRFDLRGMVFAFSSTDTRARASGFRTKYNNSRPCCSLLVFELPPSTV